MEVESSPVSRITAGAAAATSARDRSQKSLRIAMAVCWTLVIMALCWLPGPWVQRVERGSPWFQLPDLDKVIHGGIFTVFSVLWLRAVSARRRLLIVAASGVALAVLTELVQNLPIVDRDCEVGDAIVDVAGVLVGLAIAWLVEPLFRYAETLLFRKTAS
jgi:uncharacterized protein (DUF486 family)